MPIVSRSLDFQPSGSTVLASFLAVDSKGREWSRARSRFADEAAAIVALNAFDWSLHLEDFEFSELLEWVQTKNAPDDFVFVDATLLNGEEFLLIWFAKTLGDEVISLAWWVEDMNPPTYDAIRIRAGFDAAAGSRIQDRAISLLAAEPLFDAVEEV